MHFKLILKLCAAAVVAAALSSVTEITTLEMQQHHTANSGVRQFTAVFENVGSKLANREIESELTH